MIKLSHHIKHYLPLIGVLAAGTIGFLIFSYDTSFQIALAIATSFGYVTWGIVHHYLHKDLYLEVVLEYVIVAALGLVLIFSVILRA